MAQEDKPAGVGHNKPPRKTPIEKLDERIDALGAEVDHWLDGQRVENVGQMEAVDDLVEQVKDLKKVVEAAKEKKYRPVKVKLDGITEEFAPRIKRVEDWRKGLLAIVGPFKTAEKERRAAEAAAKKREAEEQMQAAKIDAENADYGNREERKRADDALAAARAAEREAQAAARENRIVGGTTTRSRPVIVDYKAVLNHIRVTDEKSLIDFCDRWVSAKFHSGARDIPGVEVKTEKVAI